MPVSHLVMQHPPGSIRAMHIMACRAACAGKYRAAVLPEEFPCDMRPVEVYGNRVIQKPELFPRIVVIIRKHSAAVVLVTELRSDL